MRQIAPPGSYHDEREIEAVTDEEHWGVVDRWDLPEDGKGDCEDFALLKRKRLAEAGVPRRAMPMTVVIDEENRQIYVFAKSDTGDNSIRMKTSDLDTIDFGTGPGQMS